MKNRIFVLFLFVFITGVFFCSLNYSFDGGPLNFKSLTTDSGFDSDFGGSSDFGSSSDYGSSSSSSSDVVFIIVFLVILIIFLMFYDDSNSHLEVDVTPDLLKQIGFKEDLSFLKDKVYEVYVEIQKAWSNNDIENVRHLLSDEMYNTYRMQIMTMINKNQRNEMNDFKLVKCFINSITLNDNVFTIKAFLNVNCKDYMIDFISNEVIRGNSDRINDYYYCLTFEMSSEDNIDKCPSCHAKITKKGKSVKCEYCGSVINRKSTNLVLVDKKMIRQSVK